MLIWSYNVGMKLTGLVMGEWIIYGLVKGQLLSCGPVKGRLLCCGLVKGELLLWMCFQVPVPVFF